MQHVVVHTWNEGGAIRVRKTFVTSSTSMACRGPLPRNTRRGPLPSRGWKGAHFGRGRSDGVDRDAAEAKLGYTMEMQIHPSAEVCVLYYSNRTTL